MTDAQGKFVWYDLLTTDVNGALAFYRDVIGWGTQPFGEGYVMWTAGGTPIGGVTALPEDRKRTGTPAHWMAHVLADDVDALTAQAASLGARVQVPPQDIPTVGRFSVVTDPQGALIALFTPRDPGMTRPAAPATRVVSWHELVTDDPEAALRFYAALFGWGKTHAVEAPMGVYQMYGKGGATYGGIAKRPKDLPAPPHWLYYVKLDDLDAALERVKRGGGRVMHGPIVVPGGDRVAQCTDPQGASFGLHGK